MPELPPTSVRKPTDPDEPERTPLHVSTRDDIEPGTIIAGKYKLLQAIGEGGMGAVWMAQQIEPVKRLVALKLIKAGMDTKTVIARFEAERQALSMMDHPNIARVFDVGTTAAGRPFFVMELVKGTPITEFCDKRKMTPKQRLELFVPVCNAIQHAHQKGIIHRDIKPSNVLVALHDDKPVPKLIDFGVAKAIGLSLTEKTLHTGFEQVVGTPLYMSPEQATFNQLDIDTRSDIYSLGVLLYELLTGTTPIERARFQKAAFDEMLRVVREEEPPKPSNRLSTTQTKSSIAAVRGTDADQLTRELRSELDWVVMKALEKDRARRYSTAFDFAGDLQRYLSGEPVQAVPPSMSYRLKKAMQKHRAFALTAAMLFLSLTGAVLGTTWGLVRALDAEKLADSRADDAQTEERKARAERDEKERARVAEAAQRVRAEALLAKQIVARALSKEDPNDWRVNALRYVDAIERIPASANDARIFLTNAILLSVQERRPLLQYLKSKWNSGPSFLLDGPPRQARLDGDNVVRIREFETGAILHELRNPGTHLHMTNISFDRARHLTVSHTSGGSSVWRVGDGKPLGDARSGSLAFSDDERYFCRTHTAEASHLTNHSMVPSSLEICNRAENRTVAMHVFSRVKPFINQGEGGGRAESPSPRSTQVEFLANGELVLFIREGRNGRDVHVFPTNREQPVLELFDCQFAELTPSREHLVVVTGHQAIWYRTIDWKRVAAIACDEQLRVTRFRAYDSYAVLTGTDQEIKPQAVFLDRSGVSILANGDLLASNSEAAVLSEGAVFHANPFGLKARPADRFHHPDAKRLALGGRYLFARNLSYGDISGFSIIDCVLDEAYPWSSGSLFSEGIEIPKLNSYCFLSQYGAPCLIPKTDLQIPLSTLRHFVRVATAGELDEAVKFRAWDEQTFEKNRRELEQSNSKVSTFPFPGAIASDRNYWLRNQVGDLQLAADDANSIQLLNRLIDVEPSAELIYRRAHYFAEHREFNRAIEEWRRGAEMEGIKDGVSVDLDNWARRTMDLPLAAWRQLDELYHKRPPLLVLFRLGRFEDVVRLARQPETTEYLGIGLAVSMNATPWMFLNYYLPVPHKAVNPNQLEYASLIYAMSLFQLGKQDEASSILESLGSNTKLWPIISGLRKEAFQLIGVPTWASRK